MDVKERLAELHAMLKEAERLAEALDDARNATPKSPQMTGMPRANHQTTLDLQMEIIERAREKFEKARENALEKLNEIEEMIDGLESYDQQKVLYFRHIYRMKWTEVADRIHFSERQAQRIHARALEALAKTERSEK